MKPTKVIVFLTVVILLMGLVLGISCGGQRPTNVFSVGSGPYAIAFDGANIWVANQSGDNVTKLKASDGSLLATYGVGSQPVGIAFDGANIWVANMLSRSVTKL